MLAAAHNPLAGSYAQAPGSAEGVGERSIGRLTHTAVGVSMMTGVRPAGQVFGDEAALHS
jgi:hypothetical protein